MDPQEELFEAQEAQKEIEHEEPAQADADQMASFAKKFGYREDGKLSPDEYLERKLRSTSGSVNVTKEIRETRRELAELKSLMFAQKKAQEEDEIKALHKQFDEAIDDNDNEEIARLAKKLARIEGSSDRGAKKSISNTDDIGDAQSVIDRFAEENPWISADEEVAEYVTEKLRVLTAQGYNPKGALNQIKRDARREFPELFDDSENAEGAEELPHERKGFAPVGGGRPSQPRGGIQSIRDLPRDAQADATEFVNWYANEYGVSKSAALKEYTAIAKNLAGKR